MSDPTRPTAAAQFRGLFRSLVLDPALLFGQAFSAEALAVAVACEAGRTRDRIFTPRVKGGTPNDIASKGAIPAGSYREGSTVSAARSRIS